MGRYIDNILVRRKKLEWIANNYTVTEHLKERVVQRDKSHDKLRDRILKSPLAWKSKTGCICIAFDLYTYIVVDSNSKDEKGKNIAIIITFIDIRKSRTPNKVFKIKREDYIEKESMYVLLKEENNICYVMYKIHTVVDEFIEDYKFSNGGNYGNI